MRPTSLSREKDGVYENVPFVRAPHLLVIRSEESRHQKKQNPLKCKMQTSAAAARVGQGENISVECEVFSTVLIHHARREKGGIL